MNKNSSEAAQRSFGDKRIRYLCYNCGSLSKTLDEAKECCKPEEVYLCGRGNRFHFDMEDAKQCKSQPRRTATCLTAR